MPVPDIGPVDAAARIAVVNRGDPALRLIRAVTEYNLEHGTGLSTIAFYTDADADASFVRAADENYLLGPALVRDARTGRTTHTYVDLTVLRRALVDTGATMAWVGWGLVSEQADFAELCAELGVIFIGPSPATLRTLGDKIGAKRLAESVGVPVAAWSGGPVDPGAEARRAADRLGYPLLVKASAGGGGRGIRVAASEAELDELIAAAAAEALAAFGDPTVFLERQVGRARHVEVQIAADAIGNVWTVGVRDCSLQRRRQKVIEESGSTILREDREQQLRLAAARLVTAAGYQGVGTVEFLVDADTGTHTFMEVNPRLQVEHTVTEATTGVDLVKLQLELSCGAQLPGVAPNAVGYAIEARVTSEDPAAGFRPAPGRVMVCDLATGTGIRTDSAVQIGDNIPAEFDPLVMKVVASGRDRREALARLTRAIDETRVVLAGGATTLGFLHRLLRMPQVVDGNVDVGIVDGLASADVLPAGESAAALCLAATVLASRSRVKAREDFLDSGRRGRPEGDPHVRRLVELRLGSISYRFDVQCTGANDFVVGYDGHMIAVQVHTGLGGRLRAQFPTFRVEAVLVDEPNAVQVDIGGTTYRCEVGAPDVLTAPFPCVVVRTLVKPGDAVVEGQPLMVVESMKMESTIGAPWSGFVSAVIASPNAQLPVGGALLRLVADAEQEVPSADRPSAEASDFDALVTAGRAAPTSTAALRLLSGFQSGTSTDVVGPIDAEDASPIISLFADVCGLVSPYRMFAASTGTAWSAQDFLFAFLRSPEQSRLSLPPDVRTEISRVLARFGADGLEPGEALDEALYRLWSAQTALPTVEPLVVALLTELLDTAADDDPLFALAELDRLAEATEGLFPAVCDCARALTFVWYVRPDFDGATPLLVRETSDPHQLLESYVRRTYPLDDVDNVVCATFAGQPAVVLKRTAPWAEERTVVAALATAAQTDSIVAELRARSFGAVALDLCTTENRRLASSPEGISRVSVVSLSGDSPVTTVRADGIAIPDGMHPAIAELVELWRLSEFDVSFVDSAGPAYVVDAVARANPADRRVFVLAYVLGTSETTTDADVTAQLEQVTRLACELLRAHLASVPLAMRAQFNRIVITVLGDYVGDETDWLAIGSRLEPLSRNLGLDKVVLRIRPTREGGRDRLIFVTAPARTGMAIGESAPSRHPIRPISPRQQHAIRLRRRGLREPYSLIDHLIARNTISSDFPPGVFVEYDLDGTELVPVDRGPGGNSAGIVVGVIEHRTEKHPEGMKRVALLSDPSRGLGALAEPECRRIIAGLALARRLSLPLEWYAVSSGARIAMTSGTENLDWVARALRAIVEFTQAGHEINVVVVGVNVGAQPYFNAEATMLMHTRGILVMVPESAMVLTGKEALDFAGAVSAPNNLGIGGYSRIMGPNGQAQYRASSVEEACQILLRHYHHAYAAPGQPSPRRRITTDPIERNVCECPHPRSADSEFDRIGDIFSDERNPDRKKPFDMRALMAAVVDQDASPLERWRDMLGAGNCITWDAHVGGIPCSVVGIESHPLPRFGAAPADGPTSWTAATLFPRSSKKLARALNSASGVRPTVVLANLAGFDGSPESLRELQLEYGAEIGRAVVNYRGPIVFCIISRYHGGAFVVFSKMLNDDMQVLAVEGARASVIGGSAAAAVVFTREVQERTAKDPRVLELERLWRTSESRDRGRLEVERSAVVDAVRASVRAEVAREFDAIHTVERALRVGSVDRIIPASELRPQIVAALERALPGMNKTN